MWGSVDVISTGVERDITRPRNFKPFLAFWRSWNSNVCMLVHVNGRLILPFATAGGQNAPRLSEIRANGMKHAWNEC